MKSIIHIIVTSLHTNEGFTLSNKGKFSWTKYLGTLLRLRTNEKRTNENRLGVSIERLMNNQIWAEKNANLRK